MKNDGGPAFPHDVSWIESENQKNMSYSGMSLRDWFAGQALRMMIRMNTPTDTDVLTKAYLYAETAYIVADAMIAQREK